MHESGESLGEGKLILQGSLLSPLLLTAYPTSPVDADEKKKESALQVNGPLAIARVIRKWRGVNAPMDLGVPP